MLLFVVASCYVKFEPCQTFWANNSQHFLCSVIAEACAIMLDPFAQLSQHFWCHVRALHMLSKVLWLLSLPRCTVAPNIVGNCCIRLHTTTNTNATTPNKAGSCSIRLRVALLIPILEIPSCWDNSRIPWIRNTFVQNISYRILGVFSPVYFWKIPTVQRLILRCQLRSGRALKFISSKYSPCYLCSSLHLQQSRHNKCNWMSLRCCCTRHFLNSYGFQPCTRLYLKRRRRYNMYRY